MSYTVLPQQTNPGANIFMNLLSNLVLQKVGQNFQEKQAAIQAQQHENELKAKLLLGGASPTSGAGQAQPPQYGTAERINPETGETQQIQTILPPSQQQAPQQAGGIKIGGQTWGMPSGIQMQPIQIGGKTVGVVGMQGGKPAFHMGLPQTDNSMDKMKTQWVQNRAMGLVGQPNPATGAPYSPEDALGQALRESPDNKDTTAMHDSRYLDIQSKRQQGIPVTTEEGAWSKAYEQQQALKPSAYAAGRGDIIQHQVLDTHNNNSPVYVSANEINMANAQTPGRYVPAGPGTSALNKTALVEDIRGAINNTRSSLDQLQTPLSTAQMAQLAYVTKSSDPKSAWSSFWKSEVASTLKPDQINYLTDVAQLHENAMAMRSVLGAGQGSDELRAAIRDTIPSAITPSGLAKAQLDKFEGQINRLSRGIPGVPLRQEAVVGQSKTPSIDPEAAKAELRRRGLIK